MASETCVSTEIKQQQPQQHEEPKTSLASIPPTNGLPTGRCMFIKLHQSLTDQRCSCESYRQIQTVPGAYCDCGHQASYHLYAQCFTDAVNPTQSSSFKIPPPRKSSTDPIKALEQRLQNLETRHALETAHWHQRLLQERHAHQETLKQLQQHISTFSQFMNAMQQLDVQRKFGEIEDRLENLMDCQQRLFDKVVSVEDFGMMLEDRVAEVEGQSNERDVRLVYKRDEVGEGVGYECDLKGAKREIESDDEIEAAGSNYKVARRE